MLSAAVLDNDTLRRMVSATQRNLMTAMVQVHNADELRYAISLSPHVICLSTDNPFTPEIELDLGNDAPDARYDPQSYPGDGQRKSQDDA